MPQDKHKELWWKPAFEIFGRISVWVVVPIVAALVVGKWLDARYGTSPWAFLSLSGIGFLISSFGIVYTAREYINKIAKEKQENDSGNKKTN